MANRSADATVAQDLASRPGDYVVVARRYRPQGFEELVGQEHIARALSNAISTKRVGHAYLFTGARGVGKTSTARILAKALNCEQGPTSNPCNRCDVCRSISSGEDVDVLEIDGASNRGIDEIRQLRQNANVRPSRSRFKIYIIDEVHMLTREAFNALLKTLEEPPEHVKFIFCTTEATKIPITILSRCQRFDFAGIVPKSIAERLTQIVQAEGVSAEPEALAVLARRASGSMRDAQSLLEQLLAFAPERITVADVHSMLGTAGEERLAHLVDRLVQHDAAAILADVDAAAQEGIDLSQLLEQLFGYFRDCMAAVVGCPPEMFLYASPTGRDAVGEAGKRMGLETILAAMQILDQTLSRLRYSTQGRTLAELALVRICTLENLEELSALIAGLQATAETLPHAGVGLPSQAAAGGESLAKKKADLTVSSQESSVAAVAVPTPEPRGESIPFNAENAGQIWRQALDQLGGLTFEPAKQYASIAISAPNQMVVQLKSGYTFAKTMFERPEHMGRLEQALLEVTGQKIRVQFTVREGESPQAAAPVATKVVSSHQRIMEVSQHPLVRRAAELFGAQPIRVDEPAKDA